MKGLRKTHIFLAAAVLLCLGLLWAGEEKAVDKPYSDNDEESEAVDLFNDGKIRLIIRLDDIGFCHAANLAFEKIANEGCVTAVSLMVTTGWLDEAVDMLKAHPEVSVGVHTCLNAEWVPYRWGPVLPVTEVPSLVDEWGHFFGTRKDFMANEPKLDEIDKELRAQVDLALRKGLRISYIDHHMGTAASTPAIRQRFEQIAKDYGLGISRWFGEKSHIIVYDIDPAQKADVLVDRVSKIDKPGTYLIVCHVGMNLPEMAVLKDLNPTGLENMAVHREAEMKALCDPRLKQVIREKNIELVGYDVFQQRFLDRMKSPY